MFIARRKNWSRQDKVCAKARADVSCEPGVLVSVAVFEAVGGWTRGVLSAPGCPSAGTCPIGSMLPFRPPGPWVGGEELSEQLADLRV